MGGNHSDVSQGSNQLNSVLEINPSNLSGELKLPPSKSHSMRWLTLASMDSTPTTISMWEIGEDVQALIDCLCELGIDWDGEVMRVGNCANHLRSWTAKIAEQRSDFSLDKQQLVTSK